MNRLHELRKIVNAIDKSDYNKMVERAKELHEDYFTFTGLLQKVAEFIGKPHFANISCDPLPKRVR